MTLDREQWIHLAKANEEVLHADLDRLRGLLTDSARTGFAEFWAQARDIASKFKTFKPLEVEARETLWADYRALCDATRALQDGERVQLAEASKAKRAQVEKALDEAEQAVTAAQTPQELSRAQALLDRTLNQIRTHPPREKARVAPKLKAVPAPKAAEEGEAVLPGEESLPAAAQSFDLPSESTADVSAEAFEAPAATETAAEAIEAPAAVEASTPAPAETAAEATAPPIEEIPAEPGEGPSAAEAAAVPPVDAPQASAPLAAAQEPPPAPPVLLRSDREACWNRWTQLRDTLKAKRAGFRKGIFEEFMGRANAFLAMMEEQDPRSIQEAIRTAQSDLKAAGLSLSEQDAVRTVLRTAWKACSDHLEAQRQERQKAHAEWIERMSAHLARWEKQALRNRALAAQILAEVADLESQAASTSDETRTAKIRQWVDRKRARLAEIEATTAELDQKVHSARAKLGNEAPEPILSLPDEELLPRREERTDERRRAPREDGTGERRRPAREREPRRGRDSASEVSREPAPHPGLNLGELLAQHLGLTAGTRGSEEKAPEDKTEHEG